MFWGPGVRTLRLRTDTVATTGLQNAAQTVGGPVTAAGWYCNGTVPATVTKTGSQLQSYIGISCYNNRPGELRFVWWFDRSSWSGWRLYSREHRYTSWTSAQAFGTYIYNQCAGGGIYDYRARYDVESRNVGGWSWNTGTGSSGRFACGTNEP